MTSPLFENTRAGRRRLLDRLVIAESPTGDRAALEQLALLLEAEAVDAGLAIARQPHPSGDHLVWRLAGTPADADPLVLVSHYDTVWPAGQLLDMPLAVEGDRLSGPGTYDAKGGLVVLLCAIRSIIEGGREHRPITVLVIADEEIGSPTARALVAEHAAGARAVLGFEPPHPDGALKTARLGSTRVRLEVQGVEAHAALDAAEGVSAIDELVDRLLDLRGLLAGHPSVIANVGTIEGGGRTNVIAGHAHADIGLRFADSETERTVLAAISTLCPVRDRAGLSVSILSSRPAWQHTDETAALLGTVTAAGASIGQPVSGRPATGAADTNITGSLGVPTLDGFGPSGGGAHAVTEWMSLSSLDERIALLVAVVDHLR